MRAPISIIIPTLNTAARLPGTLAALGEGLDAGVIRELVISDGGSHDETRTIAKAAGAIWVAGAPGRGGQLTRGAQASGGAWLLFLHSDTHLGAGWAEVVLRHLRQESSVDAQDRQRHQIRDQAAGYFRLRFRAEGVAPRLVAGWANLRARLFGLPYGDQGLLISRALYDRVGGYLDIPLMEDVAMARALRGALTPLDAEAWTSAEKYRQQGWFRRGARNLTTLLRYLCGADPFRLKRFYDGK